MAPETHEKTSLCKTHLPFAAVVVVVAAAAVAAAADVLRISS